MIPKRSDQNRNCSARKCLRWFANGSDGFHIHRFRCGWTHYKISAINIESTHDMLFWNALPQFFRGFQTCILVARTECPTTPVPCESFHVWRTFSWSVVFWARGICVLYRISVLCWWWNNQFSPKNLTLGFHLIDGELPMGVHQIRRRRIPTP